MRINHIGEHHKNKLDQWFNIVKKEGEKWVIIFQDYQQEYTVYYHNIINGRVKNFEYPSVCGIGYVGIGKYHPNNSRKIYNRWKSMIRRCYNKKEQERTPTYKDYSVAEEWYNFQVFAEWCAENWKTYMDGWELDKDILCKECKIYSPETCCFVPQEINQLFVKKFFRKNGLPKGVYNSGGSFRSRISINGNTLLLGTFKIIEEAFEVYKVEKEKYIKELADKWKGLVSDKVYQALYQYKVEI